MMAYWKRTSTTLGLLLGLVASPVFAQSANQATADQVASSLRSNPAFQASRIAIEARDGLVTLSGLVPNPALKAEAVARARQIAGVKQVNDRLAVGDLNVMPAQFNPLQLARRDQGHMHGGAGMISGGEVMGGAPIMGGTVMSGDMSGPMPEGPAIPGATQANAPGMPNYAWPSYAPYPNYSAVGYPTVYPWQAWPNIGPFHPYPEVPLDWRAVTLRWDDGLWWLDFRKHYTRPFFTPYPFGIFGY